MTTIILIALLAIIAAAFFLYAHIHIRRLQREQRRKWPQAYKQHFKK